MQWQSEVAGGSPCLQLAAPLLWDSSHLGFWFHKPHPPRVSDTVNGEVRKPCTIPVSQDNSPELRMGNTALASDSCSSGPPPSRHSVMVRGPFSGTSEPEYNSSHYHSLGTLSLSGLAPACPSTAPTAVSTGCCEAAGNALYLSEP